MSFGRRLVRCAGVTLAACALMFVAATSVAPVNPNVLDYGADGTGTVDNGPIFTRFMPALCGKTATVPAGVYKFVTAPADPKCAVSLDMASNAQFVDARGPDAAVPLMTMSDTLGASSALTADGTFNQMSLQVASTAGFCASNTGIPNPACAVKVSSNFTTSPPGSGLDHHAGEIHLIRSISGNTLTLFEPLEDGYLVSDSAIATPTALLSDLTIRGGQFVGPAVDNVNMALEVQGCYRCTFANTVFSGFNGEGNLIINDDIHFETSHISCVGVTEAALADGYCVTVQDASEFGLVTGNQCWQSGPCGTLEDSDINPGTTRHIKFVDGASYNPTGINRGGWGTHYQGQDIVFNNITCVFQVSGGGVNHCIGAAIFDIEIINSHCWYAQICYADEVTWPSPLSGYFKVVNSDATGTGQHCIVVQGPVVGGTGGYTSLVLDGNRLKNCGQNGILFTSTTAVVPGQFSASGNNITLWGSLYDAMRFSPLIRNATISNNNLNGQFTSGNGITGGDFVDTVMSGNNVVDVANNCMSLGGGVTGGMASLKILGFNCDGYGTAGAYAGIIIQDAVADLTIGNATVRGAGTGADGAISVLSPITTGVISACDIKNAQGYGVNIGGGGSNVTVQGCVIDGYNLKPGQFNGIEASPSVNGLTLVSNQISGAGTTASACVSTLNIINLVEIGDRCMQPAGSANYGLSHNVSTTGVGGGLISGNYVNAAAPIGTLAAIGYDSFGSGADAPTMTIGTNSVGGYTTPLLVGNDPGITVTWPLSAVSPAIAPTAGSCATTTVTIPGASNLTNATAVPLANPGTGVMAPAAFMSSPGAGIATVQACALSGAAPNSVAYKVSAAK